MSHRFRWALLAIALAAAVAPALAGGELSAQEDDTPTCWVRGDPADLELRASPFDSTAVALEAGIVKVCYSRPRKLGRPIMGRLVPMGEPWRLGANEATAIRVPVRATIAGVPVGPGWHSLYAIPGEREWRIVVNPEARRWGIPIDEELRAEDLGSGAVPVEAIPDTVDLMTIRLNRRGSSAAELRIEWENVRVRVPIVLGGG